MGTHKYSRTLQTFVVLSAACLMLSACRIEHKAELEKRRAAAPAGSSEKPSFNAETEVQGMWETKVLPAIDNMAIDFRELKKSMGANMDETGAKHGHREKADGPWNLATKMVGKIVAADTEMRAGTADVDVDGDGQADVQLQMGPIVKGTTLRDILPFVSFTSYTNQIDFAQLANALNDRAFESALKTIDRTNLVGKRVEVVGVFTTDNVTDMPLVTATSFKVAKK